MSRETCEEERFMDDSKWLWEGDDVKSIGCNMLCGQRHAEESK